LFSALNPIRSRLMRRETKITREKIISLTVTLWKSRGAKRVFF
jgi:hypothetical protein